MKDHERSASLKAVSQGRQAQLSQGADVAGNDRRVAVLNRLRNAINLTYGHCEGGAPRINLGPCGRFARDFRERWNARFREKVNIVFVMTRDGTYCYHVMVRLPDGSYCDGGNGVITAQALERLYPDSRLDEMTEFDLIPLDKWSYGLDRSYPACPNYSDEMTIRLIEGHLAELPMTSAAQQTSRSREA
jgi:hypothetical protein